MVFLNDKLPHPLPKHGKLIDISHPSTLCLDLLDLCKLIQLGIANNINITGIILILTVRLQVGVVVRRVAMLQEAHLQLLLLLRARRLLTNVGCQLL